MKPKPKVDAEEVMAAARDFLERDKSTKGYKLEAVSAYTDQKGTPTHWRIRAKNEWTKDKWIRPMRHNGMGFVLGAPKFENGNPLYALHYLAQNPDADVWLVEGELHADEINKRGLVATTSGSATSAASADWEPLRGRAVRIWPDFDDAGKKYADQAARLLLNLGCRVECVIVAELGLKAGGDIIDWLKSAHPKKVTGDDLRALPTTPITTATIAPMAGAVPLELTIEQASSALDCIDPDDQERWIAVGTILGRAFNQRDDAWALYETWSARSAKFADPVHHVKNVERMRDVFYKRSQLPVPIGSKPLGIGTLIMWAKEGGWVYVGAGDDGYDKFWAVRPANKYIYLPSGALWPAESVSATLPPRVVGTKPNGDPIMLRAAPWLAKYRGVDSVVFDPSFELITRDQVARKQGVIEDVGSVMLNCYQPPTLKLGDARKGERWAAHVRKLLPDRAEADHVIAWCAHRVQRPGEKVRHALVIGGPPGVGKDTIFEAIIPALGAWNCEAIEPVRVFATFNEYAAKVFIRINEVVDLHETNRFKFAEATKTLIAGSPDYVEVNVKYGTKYFARNCAGIAMTTNHATTGLYLTPDDRRHFPVETIELWGTVKERERYFTDLWAWLMDGDGFAHVGAYLHEVDLSTFNPNAPPPKTRCFHAIVANGMTGDVWLTDALGALGDPKMVRGDRLLSQCVRTGMTMENFSKLITHAMARAGYSVLPNPARKDSRHLLLGREGKKIPVTVFVLRTVLNNEHKSLFAGINKYVA